MVEGDTSVVGSERTTNEGQLKDTFENPGRRSKGNALFLLLLYLISLRLKPKVHSSSKTLLTVYSLRKWFSNFLVSGSSYFIKIMKEPSVGLFMQVTLLRFTKTEIKVLFTSSLKVTIIYLLCVNLFK